MNDWEVHDRNIGMPEGSTYSLWEIEDRRLVLSLEKPNDGEPNDGYADLVFESPEHLDDLIARLRSARVALWG